MRDPELQLRIASGQRTVLAAMAGHTRMFPPKIPIGEGEGGGNLYRIVSGWAVRRKVLSDGRSPITAILLPNEFIGTQFLMAETLFDLVEPRIVMCVQSIARSRLLHLAAGDSNIALWLLSCAMEENQRREQWSSVLAQGTTAQKLAFLLLDLHTRLSRNSSAFKGPVRIPLTQQDMADYLGVTLPHLSRISAVFRENRAIHCGYGVLEILDLGILKTLAGEMLEFWDDELIVA